MTFTKSVRTCFRKYFTFSGRASRSEYWWFILFLLLGGVVANVVDSAVFGFGQIATAPGAAAVDAGNGPVSGLFSLATLIPSLSAGWRRMHDTGRSGLYLLYPIIVMIGVTMFLGLLGGFTAVLTGDLGAIIAGAGGLVLAMATIILVLSPLIVLWWLTRPSHPGQNAYGPNPHEVSP
ncbi:DUF805 domain-containing protein [Sulfitobacter sabulilitoris]|uniref:DUF805 domain-containing protein n=1 Tax=Sulfitobacter sabulilitoris TaxID=2562655 RepID=A0A5S3Q4I3_9RHOB|nr:DUF805 domain-containing protein [Sulfitobacter sabulilitoris]TMM51592.1 DUF805 domain-containing protein [Sulfitobacter sabulilitoris]